MPGALTGPLREQRGQTHTGSDFSQGRLGGLAEQKRVRGGVDLELPLSRK